MTQPASSPLRKFLDAKTPRIQNKRSNRSSSIRAARSSQTTPRKAKRGAADFKPPAAPFKETCSCGAAIHPPYTSCCEDCWASSQHRFSGEDKSVNTMVNRHG